MSEKRYCILRLEKKKNLLALGRAYNHNYRTTESAAPHAKKELHHLNEELITDDFGVPDHNFTEIFRQRIAQSEYYKTHNVRKNAIPAIEIILSFSKEQRDRIDIEKWKAENVKWLQDHYGKENVISVMVHDDEKDLADINGTGLHLHAIILPFDERGCLNAWEMIGGPRGLSKLQSEYALAMSPFGLIRGDMDKNDRHITPAQYHKRIEEQLSKEMEHIPAPMDDESAIEYARRLEEPHWEIARDHTVDLLEYEKELLRMDQAAKKKKQAENREREKNNLDDRIKLISESKEDHKREKDFKELRELLGWGDDTPTRQQMHEAKKKLRLANNLTEAFQNYSDHDFALRVNDDLEKIMQENNHRKKALLDKTKTDMEPSVESRKK